MKLKKRTQVLLYLLSGGTALLFIGFLAYRFLMAAAFALVLEDIASDESFSLFGSDHRSVQTVGAFDDDTAEANYRFMVGGFGFEFPDGTEIDQHDNAWDILVCCFTIPKGDAFPDLTPPRFVDDARPDHASDEFTELTDKNQVIPETAKRYDLILPDDYYTKFVYSDPKSNRLWVRYGYRPPTD